MLRLPPRRLNAGSRWTKTNYQRATYEKSRLTWVNGLWSFTFCFFYPPANNFFCFQLQCIIYVTLQVEYTLYCHMCSTQMTAPQQTRLWNSWILQMRRLLVWSRTVSLHTDGRRIGWCISVVGATWSLTHSRLQK